MTPTPQQVDQLHRAAARARKAVDDAALTAQDILRQHAARHFPSAAQVAVESFWTRDYVEQGVVVTGHDGVVLSPENWPWSGDDELDEFWTGLVELAVGYGEDAVFMVKP